MAGPVSLRAWLGMLACCVSMTISAAPAVIKPDFAKARIPPGYQPQGRRDEHGLWFAMAEQEQQLSKSNLLVRDASLNSAVNRISCAVAAAYCKDVRIYIVRNPYFNASMAPNGMLVIWTGLLLRMANEDQLAAVLGHEIGHYLRTHTIQQFRSLKRNSTMDMFLTMGLATLTLPAYSRAHEKEADLFGVEWMQRAGYNPSAAYELWNYELEEARHTRNKRKTSFFFRTHPLSAQRVRYLRERAAAYPAHHSKPVSALPWLQPHYFDWMTDQIKTNRYAMTEYLLQLHQKIGVEAASIDYFKAENLRRRGQAGDLARAIGYYRQAVAARHCPPSAYRSLGYAYLKQHKPLAAGQAFRRYLQLVPAASDRAMIEFYLVPQGAVD